jgi:lipoprotein-releasing system ATP-binding protein
MVGGELARTGVARALVGGKKLILADEPTGNLDKKNSDHLAELIWKLHDELGFTLILVTHDTDLAARLPVRYRMTQGRLIGV